MVDKPTLYAGDFGAPIEVQFIGVDQLPVPIGSATVRQITLRATDNNTYRRAASFTTDGSDGKIRWLVEPGFFKQLGVWQVQGYVELPGQTLTSSVAELRVDRRL